MAGIYSWQHVCQWILLSLQTEELVPCIECEAIDSMIGIWLGFYPK